MTYILTVSYANEKVSEMSYQRLFDSMKTEPCHVLLFDNHYPLNRRFFMPELCIKYKFQYYSHGENVGLYQALAYLLYKVPAGCDKVILYDGDCYPEKDDWHIAIQKVLEAPKIACVTLMNKVNRREMYRQEFAYEIINRHNCWITKQAVTNTVCGFNLDFLRSIGGVQGGKKYYGGNEIKMWDSYTGRKWVFLMDFWELTDLITVHHDWQYHQYKLLYAHKNMDITFDQYLESKPERIEDIEKHIFG